MTENGKEKNGKPIIGTCPNCNQPAIKTGMVIACEHCDAEYRFTPSGVKVKSIGKIEDHESRLDALEIKAGLKQPAAPEVPDPDDESGDDDL